ncbi:MAG TPA: hypothetical protein VN931_12655 [Fibrobacteria bacterium]|nr:hypothetical protein [Fibrobacteria bacterium]
MNTCFRPSPLHIVRRVAGGLLIALAVATLFGFIVEHLWNALMPGLFHLPLLTWLQSIGMVLLARLLVGHVGPHHHRGGGGPWKRGPFGGWHDRHQFRDWFEGEGREAFQAWKAKEDQA